MDFACRFAPHRAFNSLISAATRWRRPISCPHCIQPFIERLGSSLAHEELEEGVFGGSTEREGAGCRGGITSGAAVRRRIQRSAAHKADRASAARPSRRTPTPDTAPRRRPGAETHTPLRATGSGKTTLLSAWLAQERRPIAWLTLDEDDDDPIRFWTMRSPRSSAPILEPPATPWALRAPQLPTMRGLMTALLNALDAVNHAIYLVFDDYHVITARAIHDALDYLLARLPPMSIWSSPVALIRRSRSHSYGRGTS